MISARPKCLFPWLAGLFSVVLLAAALQAQPASLANQPARLGEATEEINLRPHFRALVETSPLNPAIVAAQRSGGIAHEPGRPNIGRHAGPVWGHAVVENAGGRRHWLLTYVLTTIEDIEVHVRRADQAEFTRLESLSDGKWFPFTGQRLPTYRIDLEPGQKTDIVVRLRTRTPVGFHLVIIEPTRFFAEEKLQSGAAGFLTAVPLLLIAAVAILWSSLQRRELGYFLGLLITLMIVNAWLSGLGALLFPFIPRALWPGISYAMVGFIPVFAWLHARRFLALPVIARQADRLLALLAGLIVMLVACELLGLVNTRSPVQMIFPVFSLCIFVVATRAAWRGTLENILYAIAWFFFLSISLIQLARLFVVIPWAIPLTIYAQSAFASLFIGLSMIWQVQARQRELHRSLEKSNARYRLAVEGSAAAIYEYHWTSRRLEGGERLARIVDLPGIGADGSPLARIGMTSRHAIIRALVEALRKRSRHFSAEALLPKPDGGQMLSITGAILYGPDGRPSSLCGSVIDVTSEHALALERSLRSQLEIAKQRTERALAARMRIFTAINHDLRHPFLALGLYLDILNRHRDAARVEQHIDQIRAAYQSANSYLNIATEVIRNESIDEPLTFIDVDVAQMLREQQVLFSGAASSIGMVIDVQARRLFIRTDRVVLERIVGNLVANAMRHSRGTRAVLACRMIAGHPTIIISDNGRGIDTAKQTTLFHDFARREREDGEGLGVGLGIARRLAHSLGARLSLRSKPGQGTRLAISFDAPD